MRDVFYIAEGHTAESWLVTSSLLWYKVEPNKDNSTHKQVFPASLSMCVLCWSNEQDPRSCCEKSRGTQIPWVPAGLEHWLYSFSPKVLVIGPVRNHVLISVKAPSWDLTQEFLFHTHFINIYFEILWIIWELKTESLELWKKTCVFTWCHNAAKFWANS